MPERDKICPAYVQFPDGEGQSPLPWRVVGGVTTADSKSETLHATTVVGIQHAGELALAADGQVTFGQGTILKHTASKLRRLYHGEVLAGFAGGVADALALFEAFEVRLEGRRGDLERAAVELCRDWRTDRTLRRLDALLLVGDREHLLLLSGAGEVIAPDDGVLAIGSGGSYALAAARALRRFTTLSASDVAREALKIAGEICIYTNDRIQVETLGAKGGDVR